VTAPRRRDVRRLGADGEPDVEATGREVIDGDRALREPGYVVSGRVERVSDRGADAAASRIQGERGQQRPTVVGEVPEPIAVRDARVAERVGRGPVTLQGGDVRAPRLHADRDHAASIEDRERAVNARGLTPLPRVARVRPMLARLVATALVLLVTATAAADTPVEAARALVARYHEDPAAIDRARDLLENALAKDRQVDTMVMLAYVHYLWGDVRAKTDDEKLSAYDQGRQLGERAVELAPKNPDAHVWYAINTARYGQTRGVMRSLFLLPTVRREIDTILALDPKNVRAYSLAGNVDMAVPRIAGGDVARAEDYFKKGIAVDPRYTVLRVDLARLYIGSGRYAEARQELTRVLEERAPRIVADWTARDVPRARGLLESIKDKR
jgi:tetratricopeptide (TPR) repeat protein